LPDDENLLHRNGTLSEEQIVGVSCLNDSDCQAEDVNALCVNSECECRQEMQWNRVALECQVFIDVDCGDWAGYYSASNLFKEILKAEDVYKRGYKDSSEKHDLIMNITGLDSFTLSLLGTVPGKLCEFYSNGYRSTWELRRACSISKNNPGAYLLQRSLPSKYTLPVPANRTQDPEEALEGSLLSFLSMNRTDFHPITPPELIPSMVEDDEGETGRGKKHYLREAFCRSVEPFSEVFDTKAKPRFEDGLGTTWMKDPTPSYLMNYDDRINRPSKCWRIPPMSTNCARLYDSSSCSQKAWKILIRYCGCGGKTVSPGRVLFVRSSTTSSSRRQCDGMEISAALLTSLRTGSTGTTPISLLLDMAALSQDSPESTSLAKVQQSPRQI